MDNINRAVEMIRAYENEHGYWPGLSSELVSSLPLSEEQIAEAVSANRILVVFPPAGPEAYIRVP